MSGNDSINTESSDLTHNQNAFAYLLQIFQKITKEVLNLHPFLDRLLKLQEPYDLMYPYGNLYTEVIAYLEKQVEQLSPKYVKKLSLTDLNKIKELDKLDDVIWAIYHNDNGILENKDSLIKSISATTRPLSIDTSKKIKWKLSDSGKKINTVTPQDTSTLFNQVCSLFTDNFKPQHLTNLPSIKHFEYKKNESTGPIEYRFGTQAQRHNGAPRVSPLFKRWLKINAKKYPDKDICYIYFNNLGLDRSPFDIPGSKERDLSLALHRELEGDPSLKTRVVTIPASQGWMSADAYQDTEKKYAYYGVKQKLLNIARGLSEETTDFKMSNKTKSLLYGENELIILNSMLKQSFKELGIQEHERISTAQIQAVWVHFIKSKFTQFALKKIKPAGYNISCKDTTDRGILASIYHNLLESFKSDNPMQKNEFERALDAPAVNVHARGMNDNRNILWNVINHYVNAQYLTLLNNPKRFWLIHWRDMNCPHSQINEILAMRIPQAEKQFDQCISGRLKRQTKRLITNIKQQFEDNFSGKRLLLEIISRTGDLLQSPEKESIKQYENLAQDIIVNYPTLNIIGGILEAIVGIILIIPSFGFSSSLVDQGLATVRTGFFPEQNLKLHKEMLKFSSDPEFKIPLWNVTI